MIPTKQPPEKLGRFIECGPLNVATYSLATKLVIPLCIQQEHDKLDVAVWGK